MLAASVASPAVNVPPLTRPGVTELPKIDSTLHGTGLHPVQISPAACLIAASVADGFGLTGLADFLKRGELAGNVQLLDGLVSLWQLPSGN